MDVFVRFVGGERDGQKLDSRDPRDKAETDDILQMTNCEVAREYHCIGSSTGTRRNRLLIYKIANVPPITSAAVMLTLAFVKES